MGRLVMRVRYQYMLVAGIMWVVILWLIAGCEVAHERANADRTCEWVYTEVGKDREVVMTREDCTERSTASSTRSAF